MSFSERPLVIHNCKFDIRQWFLVTSVQPLVIWMYKESYLRFSSQEYDLVNFHESIHLTNHAVQKRYENGKRDERLPRENMWDCHTFQAYLRQIGRADVWSERIYPGMRRALIGMMLASQETMDRRMSTFELFGADFMISEDFTPWLIEINSSPDLGASTSVTARLCPQCLEDVIKGWYTHVYTIHFIAMLILFVQISVVVDYKNDPKSSTGGFELIYKQNIPPAPAYLGLNLSVRGSQISAKSLAAKKDKFKDTFRSKTDLTASNLNLTYSNLAEKSDNGKIVNSSPRVITMNLDNSLNKENVITVLPKAPMKAFKMDKLQASKMIIENELSKYKGKRAISRQKTSLILKNENIPTKSLTSINLDSSRRHKSCGPRLAPVSLQSKDPLTQDNEMNSNDASGKSELIECIGNKCGSDNQLESPGKSSARNDNSPRKTTTTNRVQLKPLSSNLKAMASPYSKPQKTVDNNENAKVKKKRTLTALNREKDVHINAIARKTSNAHNSQFFAVGLSLQAWHSKYNHILKNSNRNENGLQLAKAYGQVTSKSRK